MPMRLNADLMAEIADLALRAERMFLRCQFDADTPAEIEWAEAGKRHARGLSKIVRELPARPTVAAQMPP